jgi:hypothetical protein
MSRMSNPPLSLPMVPSPGADILDCFDQALRIAIQLHAVVTFEFNEVHCGVRPCDYGSPELREIFVRNYHHELAKTTGCKICYANP